MRIEVNAAAKLLSKDFRNALLAGLSIMVALTSCGGGGGGDDSFSCLYSAPRITSSAPTIATAGYQYTYPVSAAYNCAVSSGVEACHDVVGVQLPAGASSSGNSISWNPPASEVNTDVNFAVSTPPDVCGNQAAQSWTVHVYAPPVIESFAAERDVIVPGESTMLTGTFRGGGRIEGLGSVTSGVRIATPVLKNSTSFTLIVTNDVGVGVGQSLTVKMDIPPTVTSTSPVNGGIRVPVNQLIVSTFSEKMDGATLTSATFVLKDGANNPVTGTVTYTDQVATFVPANPLGYLAQYTATISNGVRDLVGNPMAANYSWVFATGPAPDTTPPTVISTSPANGAVRVAPEDIRLLVTFGESVDPNSVNSSTFILKDGSGNLVNGAVRVTNEGNVAEFSPSVALAPMSSYTAIVTTGIKDLAGNMLAAGYSWNFATDTFGTWQATSTIGAALARYMHTAVWTGREMIVWGGYYLTTGARYNPVSDDWVPTSNIDTPSLRWSHTAVWTGSEMIVWGGQGDTNLNTGARFNPVKDTWLPTSTVGAPSGRFSNTAVWTGSEMIVWGGWNDQGSQNGGARYNPSTDTWLPTSTIGAPSARRGHTTVWTGSEMIVWGGYDIVAGRIAVTDSGARYNPVTDTWVPTSNVGAPSGRFLHTAVWTGSEMIVWGGGDSISAIDSGARYNPVTDRWASTSNVDAPSGRFSHTAVWTGTEVIVWGGDGDFSFSGRGARYNPVTDLWAPTSNVGAPPGRFSHTAVWTGTEMIVWGGGTHVWASPYTYTLTLDTGGRYRP